MVFLFILLIIIIILIFSKIRIEIENFRFTSNLPRHINKDYKVVVKLCILGELPILKISINRRKLEKFQVKEKIQELELKVIEDRKYFDKKSLEKIKLVKKKMKIFIKDIDLKMELSTENAGVTAIIVSIVSTVISIYLSKKIKEPNNQKFKIIPVYINQNLINILFSGIFEIKMIHIINIIYILNKKEGVDKYERTSNRRSYDYSYE